MLIIEYKQKFSINLPCMFVCFYVILFNILFILFSFFNYFTRMILRIDRYCLLIHMDNRGFIIIRYNATRNNNEAMNFGINKNIYIYIYF